MAEADIPKDLSVQQVEFWEYYYQSKVTPWELDMPSPPFKTFLESANALPPGKIAALGCGTGHDCILFANHGFTVTGFDFAPSAVAAVKEKFETAGILNKRGFAVQKNIFDLHDFNGQFDYVLEHTCFCAIDPLKRNAYSEVVRGLLKPDGKLIGLWWLLNRKEKGSGPPFSVSKSEIFALFSPDFECQLEYTPEDSVEDRAGKELFTIFARRT